MECATGGESRCQKTTLCMKGTGKKICIRAGEGWFTPVGMCTRASGRAESGMGRESTPKKMGLIIQESGRRTSSMDMELTNGKMGLHIKEIMWTEWLRAGEYLNGQMVLSTRDSSVRTGSMDRVFSPRKTGFRTLELSLTTRWTARAKCTGLRIGKCTGGNSGMTRGRVTECWPGKTAGSMRESGNRICSTVRGGWKIRRGSGIVEGGRTVGYVRSDKFILLTLTGCKYNIKIRLFSNQKVFMIHFPEYCNDYSCLWKAHVPLKPSGLPPPSKNRW